MPRILSGVSYSPSSQIASTSVTSRLTCCTGADQIGADGACGAVVAVAAPDEMQDAGERQRGQRRRREARHTAERLPVTSAATKNSGTPIGTVIAMRLRDRAR